MLDFLMTIKGLLIFPSSFLDIFFFGSAWIDFGINNLIYWKVVSGEVI